MSCWSFVKALILFVALLALFASACGQKDSLRNEVIKAIDKMSEVESFRSTTNRITLTDSYVQSYLALLEYSGSCINHLYEITAKNSAGNTTTITIPFDTDWYLEPGTPTSWQESIVIHSAGYWRSSDHPNWGWALVECWGGFSSLDNQLYLYRFLGNIEELSAENVGNVSCRLYKGSVNYDSYLDMQIEEMRKLQETPIIILGGGGNISWTERMERTRQSETVAEFWVDEAGYIRQLKSENRFLNVPTDTQDEWTTEVTVIRYSDFNQPITIKPPSSPAFIFPTPSPS